MDYSREDQEIIYHSGGFGGEVWLALLVVISIPRGFEIDSYYVEMSLHWLERGQERDVRATGR